MSDITELEDSIRQTLHARVSHLSPEHLSPERLGATDIAPPAREQHRRAARRVLLPVAAAAAVVAVAVGIAAGRSGDDSRHTSSPAASSHADSVDLAGTEWRLEYLALDDAIQRPPASFVATIGFNHIAGTYGSDGCNVYSGPVTVGTSTIEFGLLGSSDVYCPGLSNTFEHLIPKANHWTRTGSELTLATPDGWIMVFRRVPRGTIDWPGSR
jgi:heat shock protein HslJ